MSEMVERVAHAIIKAQREHGEDYYDGIARAAIAAMREPTEGMVEAAIYADIPGGRWGEPTFRESSIDKSDAPVIWQAMIDEALK